MLVYKAGARAGRTGTASVPAGLDQAALTSIVLGVAACSAGTKDTFTSFESTPGRASWMT
jgi:hypothetical protein